MQRRVCLLILLAAVGVIAWQIFTVRPDQRVILLALIAGVLAGMGLADAAENEPRVSERRVRRRAAAIRRRTLDEMADVDPLLLAELRTDERSVAGAMVNQLAHELALLLETTEADARADRRSRWPG